MWNGGWIQTENPVNARDLGGMPAADGRTIRPCRLLRSASLTMATENDMRKLVEEHDLRMIVDLRGPEEASYSPDPIFESVRYIGNPILESRKLGITHEEDILTAARRVNQGHDHMIEVYRKMITDDRALSHFRQAINYALEQREGALVYHCTAGKDRTGLTMALIQMALGVPQDLIIEDYLYSNTCLKKSYDAIMAEVLIKTNDETAIANAHAMCIADQEYIDTALTAMILDCGDYKTFLKERLGLDEAAKEKLKDMYLE